MRVVALVHFSMPWRCAGSETVIHELLRHAANDGHSVTLYCTNRDAQRTWTGREPVEWLDGVELVRCRNVIMASRQAAATRPDVVVSHHQHAAHAIRSAKTMGARSVYLTHNQMDINGRPLALLPDLVIHNSQWVKESLEERFTVPPESMVFHPPLTPDRHVVQATGDAITLVNLNQDKGALVFYDLAARMPDRKFLGVIGGHGEQIIRRNLPNVTIWDHDPDMRKVWAQTRVLLMPSVYESYGLVAVEAGLNGIPTIANPTPGLVENLGNGGMFADRETWQEWAEMFTRLDDTETYLTHSAYATARAADAVAATRDTLKQWGQWVQG